jgi:antitoxin MazE
MEPKEEEQHNANQEEKTKPEATADETEKKGVNHMATVQKWGNSLAVRIPNEFAKNLGVTNGSKIELQLFDDELIVKPVKTKPTLEALLARAKGKTNPHLDYDFGMPEGKELI